MTAFVAAHGNGDQRRADQYQEKMLQRLEHEHPRYVSIFGPWRFRCVYGTQEGQSRTRTPLDARLGLPAGEISYVLEDWLGRICLKDAFRESVNSLVELLGVRESLGRHGRRTFSADGPAWHLVRLATDAAVEGEVNCWWPRPMARASPCSRLADPPRLHAPPHRAAVKARRPTRSKCPTWASSTASLAFRPFPWTRSWTNCSEAAGQGSAASSSTSMWAEMTRPGDGVLEGMLLHGPSYLFAGLAVECQARNPARKC